MSTEGASPWPGQSCPSTPPPSYGKAPVQFNVATSSITATDTEPRNESRPYGLRFCSLRRRVAWVAAYNLVSGILSLIAGIFLAVNLHKFVLLYGFFAGITGLCIATGLLLLLAGTLLLLGLSKERKKYFTVWLVISGILICLTVATLGFSIYMVIRSYTGVLRGTVGSSVIQLIFQVACHITVVNHWSALLN